MNAAFAKKHFNQQKLENINNAFAVNATEKDTGAIIESTTEFKKRSTCLFLLFSMQKFKSIVDSILHVNGQLFFIAQN